MASIRPYRTPKSGERRYEVRWREDGVAKSHTLTTMADAKLFQNETERRLRMGLLHEDKARATRQRERSVTGHPSLIEFRYRRSS